MTTGSVTERGLYALPGQPYGGSRRCRNCPGADRTRKTETNRDADAGLDGKPLQLRMSDERRTTEDQPQNPRVPSGFDFLSRAQGN